MNSLTFNRKNLSGFYIASIFSYFLFDLSDGFISDAANWFYNFFTTVINPAYQPSSDALFYLSFVLVCFAITIIIKMQVTDKLGFYTDSEGAPIWEIVVLIVLIGGFYLYIINQVINPIMPTQWFGETGIMLLGNDSTRGVGASSTSEATVWSIVPWLWTIAPIGFLYARVNVKSGGEEE